MSHSGFHFSYTIIHTKLNCVEEERTRYEELQKDMEELRKNLEECRNGTASSANHVNEIKEERNTNERPVDGENIVTKAK